jgi:integrase
MVTEREEREHNRLDDAAIRRKLRAGERFELSDGGGLTLAYRDGYKAPVWRLRYRIGGERGRDGKAGRTGTPRVIVLGKYTDMSLAKARADAKQLRARVTQGHDVAAEKQERHRAAVERIEATRNVYTVARLADEYFERHILGRWAHPDIVRSRIEKRIKPAIGKLPVQDVKPRHIDGMLKAIVKDGAPTIANDVLRWTRRMFNHAVKLELVNGNPASVFTLADAGGKEEARERALSRDELVKFFAAMRKTPGLSVENVLTFKLLLLLAVRKGELTQARVAEFDLGNATWELPADRTKTGAALDIPLPPAAVEALRELVRLGEGSEYLLPARKAQERMLPHIHENTLNVALSKVRKHMPGVEPFTIHDFRRTARTQLAALGVSAHIAERCLNHKLKGVEGVYDRHEYFDERRSALNELAEVIDQCESGKPANVVPMKRKAGPRGR